MAFIRRRVDPRSYPRVEPAQNDGQPGVGPPDQRTNHQQGIKLDMGEARPAAVAATKNDRVVEDPTSFAWKELRRSPRIRCSGRAEFRTEGSDEHQWGTLTDISLHGCYVEMDATFPVDTRVYLILQSLGIRIQARGIVRTCNPTLGMGIAFDELEPGQQQQLQGLCDALTGSKPISKLVSGQENHHENTMFIDPIAFLDEMTEFFRKKQLLSREEFHQIAKRVRRP